MSQERSSAQINEQEIQFKKRARRRLVGAIALVLLMVTVLPMVLDDRAAKAPQPEIAISIPSQDGTEFTSKIVPISPETKSPETLPTAPPTQSKPQPATSAESAQSDDRSANKTAESSAPIAPPSAKPVDKPTEPVTPKAQTVETGPAQHAAVEKKTPEPNSSSSNELSVQIGVFSDPANVKQLQQKLLAQGFQSYTEKLDTEKGEKIRLRAGPFANRADAENALAKIKDSGMSGMIVTNK